MATTDRKAQQALKFGIKTLILQEVRLLRLERAFTPRILLETESRSLEQTKQEIIRLARGVSGKEREGLLRKMVHKAVDEEVDRAIQLRGNKCLRCIHVRYYDRDGLSHAALPTETNLPRAVGCEVLAPGLKKKCHAYVEASGAASLEDYLNEMTLLYEFGEIFDRIDNIWKNYFKK
jgi:hypothetical protein